MSANIKSWCQARSPMVRNSGRRHDAKTADHTFRDEQCRSYDIATKGQRNQGHSDEP